MGGPYTSLVLGAPPTSEAGVIDQVVDSAMVGATYGGASPATTVPDTGQMFPQAFPGSGSGGGVLSLNGETGDVSVSAGAGIIVTASGQNVGVAGQLMVGDTGSGGQQGDVPSPSSGDAAAGKFLKADGTWKAPVSTLNGETGAVTLVAGSNIIITPSGQNITIDAAGGSGGGGNPYYGFGFATAAGLENVVTLGSSPLPDSTELFINGVLVLPNRYSFSGNVATFPDSYLATGDVLAARWATASSSPGGVAISSSIIAPALRGANVANGDSSTVLLPLPTGSQVGDLAVIFGSNGYGVNNPSGWTSLQNYPGGSWMGQISSKLLDATDISTGSISMPTTGWYWTGAIVVFQGAAGGIRESEANQTSGGSLSISTSASVIASDVILAYGSVRSGNVVATVDQGLKEGSYSGAYNGCCLYYIPVLTNGAQSIGFNYNPSGGSQFQGLVVVENG